jgi:hypothetical protein
MAGPAGIALPFTGMPSSRKLENLSMWWKNINLLPFMPYRTLQHCAAPLRGVRMLFQSLADTESAIP